MVHLIKGVFLLCFSRVCGIVGSIVGCSLAMPLAPLQP